MSKKLRLNFFDRVKVFTLIISKIRNFPRYTLWSVYLFCAISVENMEHFIFLLEKLGFEVKQGKHIAVKVPGMKRFKRLDTISEDLSRESLEAMFRYGDASLAAPVNRAVSLLPARKAVFSPYQRKCYARRYRLHLAEKKRFTYKSGMREKKGERNRNSR